MHAQSSPLNARNIFFALTLCLHSPFRGLALEFPQAVLEKHNRELSWQVAMLADGSSASAAASAAASGGAGATPGGLGKGKGGRVAVEIGPNGGPLAPKARRNFLLILVGV